MREIQLHEAEAPLVMAIDVGSSSVRALLYDAQGRHIDGTEHRCRHALRTTPDGGSMADADNLVALTVTCIDQTVALAAERASDIAAVGLTTFWHSLLGVDADRAPTTPVLMWADTRSGEDARSLSRILDRDRIHTETGCLPHSSYWPAKLRWLQRTDPDTVARTAMWVSFPDYLSWVLHHEMLTSISMASGTGLLDSSGARWHEGMVDALGLNQSALPKLSDRDIALPPPAGVYRTRWPALAGAAWFPAIGDGATANVGAGCVGADRIALTIGTSGAMRAIIRDEIDHRAMDRPLSPKLWQYRLDRQHRVAGGALSNGGNVAAWLANLVRDPDFTGLVREAEAMAPDAHGLIVLPFLAGERSPSWNDRLTGTIAGLRLDTTAGELYRALLEATAYRFASIYEDLDDLVSTEHVIRANGAAVLGSPLWLQILSDTLGRPIDALDAEAEASARGAAICALQSVRAIDSLLAPETGVVHTYRPDAASYNIYRTGRERLERYEAAFAAFLDTSGR